MDLETKKSGEKSILIICGNLFPPSVTLDLIDGMLRRGALSCKQGRCFLKTYFWLCKNTYLRQRKTLYQSTKTVEKRDYDASLQRKNTGLQATQSEAQQRTSEA